MNGDQELSQGQQPDSASSSQFNALDFIIRQALGKVRTMTPVQVQAVYATKSDAENNSPVKQSGNVAPVGFVDVLPLVNLIDGVGTATEHVPVFGLPYARLQGGGNAIIADPEVGDIGLAIISDRDISSVKENKAQANPGSFRRFNLADGVYLGGILNDTANQYLQFTPTGLTVVDKNGNTVVMAPSGITVTDVNKNIITTSATGISVLDLSTNTITTDPTGIILTDVTKNSILMQPGGVSIINADGSEATMVGNVLNIKDNSGNSIVSSTNGMTLTDKSGNKIDMTPSAIAITGNLTVSGTVTAGQGGGDQVGLQTHKHPTAGTGIPSSPTAGT